VSCLLSNAFLTLLFIPFFYTRIGSGYCVSVLCQFIPYGFTIVKILYFLDQYFFSVKSFGVFLTMTMFSAFGIMLIARHQIIIADNSIFKMKPVTKYVLEVLISSSKRQNQIKHLRDDVRLQQT
ncbi:hypothetical protein PENTCL1PPCAC_16169, partial [Pristionchus entomophagus]